MKKEKEWLKDKIKDEEYDLKYVYDNYVPYEKVLISDDVYYLIDQLDEQDKPVIPKFVADWIEKQMKFGYEDVFISMTRLRERAPEKVKFWFRNNSDTYARAWLDGYEVEKEKKWVVKQRELYLKSFDIWREECNNAEFVFDKESTIKFTDKVKAEAVALLVDGTVEEVNGND